MAVINTNVKALFSQMALGASGRAQTVAMQQLSTGKRINSARDDAAGMAISTRMTQQIRSLNQAVRNAGDAISMIQTAEGATNEITDMLQRMRELAVQAANDTNSNEQRSYLDLEFQQLKKQIVQISDNTEWNGFSILNGSAGDRVGERPVYKTVSVGQQSDTFISPSRLITPKNGMDADYVKGFALADVSISAADATKFMSFSDGVHTYYVPHGATATATLQAMRDKINGTANANVASNGYTAKVDATGLVLTKTDEAKTLPNFTLTTNNQAGQVYDLAGMTTPPATGDVVKFEVLLNTSNTVSITSIPIAGGSTPVTLSDAIKDAISKFNADAGLNQDYKAVAEPATGTATGIKIFALKGGRTDGSVQAAVAVKVGPAGSETAVTDVRSNIGTLPVDVPEDVSSTGPKVSDKVHTLDVQESFTNQGTFLKSGKLSMTVDANAPSVTATFMTSDEKSYDMVGEVDVVSGTVTFKASDPNNQNLITQDLTYVIKNNDLGTPVTQNLATYKDATTQIEVDVAGGIPALNDGDIVINGVTIAKTCWADDKISPPNNAAGSAIAKAAAINRVTHLTGVHAVVNENVAIGTAMQGTAVVKGRVIINGVESPMLTTSLNNPRKSREDVVRALNLISDKTGVTAVDTGIDAQGIKLVAKDGRNIEVEFALDPINGPDATEFAQRTGLRSGVHAGTYSLEAKVEQHIEIGTTPTGNLSHSGLTPADNKVNVSAVNTDARVVVKGKDPTIPDYVPTPVALKTGDLMINGVAIPGALPKNDRLTQPDSYQYSKTSDLVSSAIAMANAINSQTAATGVTAVANPAVTSGALAQIDSGTTDGWKHLYINGIDVPVQFIATQKPSERMHDMALAINAKLGAHGVEASENINGGMTLKTLDGRNLSVWFDDSLDASEFGLADQSGKAVPGVTAVGSATAQSTDADTLYATVSLQSAKPIKVEPGVNGYGAESNFEKLGFQTGTFGGVVDDAVTKMSPPRTGRLSFQVGSNVHQYITIDLADFGKGGPITGDLTWDVDMDAPPPGAALEAPNVDGQQRSFISSKESATSVLARLDVVMEKVNATRATMGAVMNRLDHVINNLTNVSMNMSASRSQIEDADYAAASTELAKTQIMQQAATAVLAQANTSQQSVMKLLGG